MNDKVFSFDDAIAMAKGCLDYIEQLELQQKALQAYVDNSRSAVKSLANLLSLAMEADDYGGLGDRIRSEVVSIRDLIQAEIK